MRGAFSLLLLVVVVLAPARRIVRHTPSAPFALRALRRHAGPISVTKGDRGFRGKEDAYIGRSVRNRSGPRRGPVEEKTRFGI